MKEPFLRIKNKLNKLVSFKKINPHNHWNILQYIFLIIISMLIIFSLYLLINIKNQQALQLAPDFKNPPSLVNEKLLNKVMESFDIKAQKEKEIKSGTISYKDPSI